MLVFIAAACGALGGAFVGALCGMYLGSMIMIRAVKEEFK
jgi:hypothetical protein